MSTAPQLTEVSTPSDRPTRTPSKETVLKRDMARIKRELDALETKIAKFEEMRDEMAHAEATRTDLQHQLAQVKEDLIAELGLD